MKLKSFEQAPHIIMVPGHLEALQQHNCIDIILKNYMIKAGVEIRIFLQYRLKLGLANSGFAKGTQMGIDWWEEVLTA